MDDADVLARIDRGDSRAIRSVIDEFGPKLLNYIARLIGDRWAAEDLLQEVFVKLIHKARTIRDEKNLTSWLYAVARNHAINYLKHRQTIRETRPPAPTNPRRPDEDVAQQELAQAIQRALDELEEPFRTTFILCALEGMEYEAVAKIMDCSVNTVGTRYFRARAKFRDLMRPFYERSTYGRM